MMLVTSTRSPPSCVARLPQKFSAATTFGFPSEDPPGPDEQAERLTRSSAPRPIPTSGREERVMAESEIDARRQAIPMVSYEDVAAAAEWLVATFGFAETGQRYTDGDGRVTHAELELAVARVML